MIQGPSKAEFGVTGKIGINFDPDGTITEIARNTPASIAGLKEGDKILRIDGELIPKNNITALLSMITGKPGTTVILVVDRAGNELSFTIKRKKM